MPAAAAPDRVVIADDDFRTRELLRVLLSFAPAIEIVGEAEDGAEAVKLALERRADAVVLDINMPGLDGGRAAEVIRAYRPRVKVLFHTAEVDGELRRRAERLQAPILLKGDPDLALHMLEDLLAGRPDTLDPLVKIVLAALERHEGDAVVVVDAREHVLFYDSGAAELIGAPYEPGRALKQLGIELPLGQALADKAPVSAEVEIGDRAFAVSAVPLVGDDGKVVGGAAYLTQR